MVQKNDDNCILILNYQLSSNKLQLLNNMLNDTIHEISVMNIGNLNTVIINSVLIPILNDTVHQYKCYNVMNNLLEYSNYAVFNNLLYSIKQTCYK